MDINNDGLSDIFFCGKRINDYLNQSDFIFTELTDIGFSSQAVFIDMDQDGDPGIFQINQPPDLQIFYRHKIPKEQKTLNKQR